MTDERPAISTPRVAAGVVFLDGQSRVLMVRPTYKEYWDIPGGYVEPGESPYDAAVREVREELGLEVNVGRMLVVDWAPSQSEGDKLLFLFRAPELSANTVFHFEDGEIAEVRYVHPDDLADFTIERLVRRLRVAVEATVPQYLEHGRFVAGDTT